MIKRAPMGKSMKYEILFLSIVTVLVAAGCAKRVTRQFIVADSRVEVRTSGDWLIMNPKVVAFKDVINLEAIADTTMFWISMRASKARSVGIESAGDLTIDSVKVSFLPDGGEYWRRPTRVALFSDPSDKFAQKVFDFFGDQGIVIPMGVDSILVEFEALSIDDGGEVILREPMVFKMVRDEKRLSVPLLQQ